jgi:hypothetical protein
MPAEAFQTREVAFTYGPKRVNAEMRRAGDAEDVRVED